MQLEHYSLSGLFDIAYQLVRTQAKSYFKQLIPKVLPRICFLFALTLILSFFRLSLGILNILILFAQMHIIQKASASIFKNVYEELGLSDDIPSTLNQGSNWFTKMLLIILIGVLIYQTMFLSVAFIVLPIVIIPGILILIPYLIIHAKSIKSSIIHLAKFRPASLNTLREQWQEGQLQVWFNNLKRQTCFSLMRQLATTSIFIGLFCFIFVSFSWLSYFLNLPAFLTINLPLLALFQILFTLGTLYDNIALKLYNLQYYNQTNGIKLQERIDTMQQSTLAPDIIQKINAV